MVSLNITDVAREAGVALGTVSRVINNAPHVSRQKAEAVRKAMAKLGYVPPSPERRRGPRPRTKAGVTADKSFLLLLGSQGLNWMLNMAPVYSQVIHGVEQAVRERGFSLIIRQVDERSRDLTTIVQQHRVEGAVFFERMLDGVQQQLAGVPCACVMGSPFPLQCDHILPDHDAIGLLAAEHLLKLGHKHMAYIGIASGDWRDQPGRRGLSFQNAIRAAGGTVLTLTDPMLLQRDETHHAVNRDVLRRLITQLLATKPRPTGIMLFADLLVQSVYSELRAAGLRPGRDPDIVTCNNEAPYLAGLDPLPTIIDIQATMIGRRAVDQLLWRKENPSEPRNRIAVEPRLIKSTDN
jgi:LacI family transcriptional regulator